MKRGNHLSSKQVTVTEDELIVVLHLPSVSLIRHITRNYIMTYLYPKTKPRTSKQAVAEKMISSH